MARNGKDATGPADVQAEAAFHREGRGSLKGQVEFSMPDYTDYHEDGDCKYQRCNVAEDHASRNPGHSVHVVSSMSDPDTDGYQHPILRVYCTGTEGAFMNDKRDCDFSEELFLNTEKA